MGTLWKTCDVAYSIGGIILLYAVITLVVVAIIWVIKNW